MLGCVGHDATVWLSDCEWKKMGGGMLGEYMRQRGSIFLEGILAKGRKKERAMMLVSNFRWIKENVPDWVQAVVASPDEGGTRRAGQFLNNIEE